MVRHHPQWLWIKDYIKSNKIGSINAITTLFSYKNTQNSSGGKEPRMARA